MTKAAAGWNDTGFLYSRSPLRITRIAPSSQSIAFDFEDDTGDSKTEYAVCVTETGTEETRTLPAETETHADLRGLRPGRTYSFFVRRQTDGQCSESRLAKTGRVPGRVVTAVNPEDPFFRETGNDSIGTPCLYRTKSGTLLASVCDPARNLTALYASETDGESWEYLSSLFPCCGGQLFEHKDALLMLACSRKGGDLLIGRSENGGRDFSEPTVLFRGTGCRTVPAKDGSFREIPEAGSILRAPAPMHRTDGMLMTALTVGKGPGRPASVHLLYARKDAEDLTDPAAWTLSDGWEDCEDLLPEAPAGTVLETPDENTCLVLCGKAGTAVCLHIDPEHPGRAPAFADLLPTAAASGHCELHPDPETGRIYTVACEAAAEDPGNHTRLALFCGETLSTMEPQAVLIDASAMSPDLTGFRNVSFLIEGEDLLFLSETAWHLPKKSAEGNVLTFHRISGFRTAG